MPRVHLTPAFASDPPRPKTSAKADYFDTDIPGFLLEVRATGRATYYQPARALAAGSHNPCRFSRIEHSLTCRLYLALSPITSLITQRRL